MALILRRRACNLKLYHSDLHSKESLRFTGLTLRRLKTSPTDIRPDDYSEQYMHVDI